MDQEVTTREARPLTHVSLVSPSFALRSQPRRSLLVRRTRMAGPRRPSPPGRVRPISPLSFLFPPRALLSPFLRPLAYDPFCSQTPPTSCFLSAFLFRCGWNINLDGFLRMDERGPHYGQSLFLSPLPPLSFPSGFLSRPFRPELIFDGVGGWQTDVYDPQGRWFFDTPDGGKRYLPK